MTIRVGVIGAGIMGSDHAAIADGRVSGATVTAVADLDVERAAAVVRSLRNARVAESPFELIAAEDVDAIVVASADASHAEYTLAAIAAGKPVLCEKPLAPDVGSCDAIVDADDRARERLGRGLVSVGFMRRFDPAYVSLKQAIVEESIGRTVLLNCESRGVTSGPGTTSEGAITGSTIHELDIVPWLLDSPVVEARWDAPVSAVEGLVDPHVVTLRTESGALAVVETYLNARYGYDIRCEAVGTTGTAAIHTTDDGRVTITGELHRAESYGADWRRRFAEAYRIEVQAWVDSLRDEQPSPLADARAGRAATVLAQAVIDSMHERRTVEVPR
ncbi:myo-inositol 2-dehydrogenase/D-chiro-inositol 1-dehydrogenase [Leifsonia sp. EB41]|uniref:Gfo/Idh/MocA family protein n=1 Tax=Leifsonia sp. EB41 TaxID=3156260 RepID=UPI0035186E2D